MSEVLHDMNIHDMKEHGNYHEKYLMSDAGFKDFKLSEDCTYCFNTKNNRDVGV